MISVISYLIETTVNITKQQREVNAIRQGLRNQKLAIANLHSNIYKTVADDLQQHVDAGKIGRIVTGSH